MTTVTDKRQHYDTISKTCLTANVAYLFLHIFYLILFIIARVDILTYIDAAVIVIYLLFFWLLQKKKYYIYALCCGNLFFAFISVTTIMLGFNTGFHLYLIGLCVVSFFTSYFSKVKRISNSMIWVGLSVAIYLTLYFVTKFNAPYYTIEPWLEITLFTTHAIVVFVFVAGYMAVFVKYALSLERRILSESRTDELTQIGNRYSLYDYFDSEPDKSTKVLALFDIDDFKNINDRYGHVTGDFVLQRVAKIATDELKDGFVCRYGGEEFVVVLDDTLGDVLSRLETFRKRIEEESFDFQEAKMRITVTIGAAKHVQGIELEKWVDLADDRMYVGKNSGKNRVVF